MLRKWIAIALMCAMMLGATGAMAEAVVYPETVRELFGQSLYGFVYAYRGLGYEWEELPWRPIPEQPERLIYVWNPLCALWVRIPDDGPDAEAYYQKGVRFTIDEQSFDAELLSLSAQPFDAPVVERPVSVELIAETYAFVEAVGENALTLTVIYRDDALGQPGDTVQLAYDADTLCYIGEEPEHIVGDPAEICPPGQSFEILYDPGTLTVLLMWAVNG